MKLNIELSSSSLKLYSVPSPPIVPFLIVNVPVNYVVPLNVNVYPFKSKTPVVIGKAVKSLDAIKSAFAFGFFPLSAALITLFYTAFTDVSLSTESIVMPVGISREQALTYPLLSIYTGFVLEPICGCDLFVPIFSAYPEFATVPESVGLMIEV